MKKLLHVDRQAITCRLTCKEQNIVSTKSNSGAAHAHSQHTKRSHRRYELGYHLAGIF